jgi:hypothetical protein
MHCPQNRRPKSSGRTRGRGEAGEPVAGLGDPPEDFVDLPVVW